MNAAAFKSNAGAVVALT